MKNLLAEGPWASLVLILVMFQPLEMDSIQTLFSCYLVKRQTLDIRYKREMANGRRNNNGSILNTDISFKMICFAMESSVIG